MYYKLRQNIPLQVMSVISGTLVMFIEKEHICGVNLFSTSTQAINCKSSILQLVWKPVMLVNAHLYHNIIDGVAVMLSTS